MPYWRLFLRVLHGKASAADGLVRVLHHFSAPATASGIHPG
jgi:hypothetical protein